MFKRLLLLAAFSSQAVLAQRYERLIETRTISNHEIVGAEYDASTNAVFILSNVSNQNGNGLLAKVNSINGDTIWSKFVAPTVQQENFKGLYKSSNALFAYGLRTFQSAQYAFIAKLDFNGDTIWTKHYKTLATTACTNPHITINGLTELANGDLVLVGRNNACDRAVLLKTNSLGVVSLIKEYEQWLQNIYSPLWEFYGIESDGTNFFVSARYGKAQQNWDYYKGIWKLDLNGDLVTNFNSQFAQNSEVFGFKRDAAGNFYLLGQHNPISQNVGILEKFSAAGASLWAYSPSGVTIQWSGITDIELDASGDVLVSGFFQKQNQSVDQFAARINASTGAEIWLKQYGYNDNGYGRDLVKIGTNYLMVSDENFGWGAWDTYGVDESNPPQSHHPVIQVFDSNGHIGRFKKSPNQLSKRGKDIFFADVIFEFQNFSDWSNVNLIPLSLASPTGGNSAFQVWNGNLNYTIYSTQYNQTDNGVGTFYFTASDKNGDTRISDTLEVLPFPSFNALDIYGSPSIIACTGDSLLLAADNQNVGSTLKWFYTGVSGNQTAVKIGVGTNVYAKDKGYYFLREILANGDSASTNQILLNIETDQVNIVSSSYPQSFWVTGEASDSTNRKTPNAINWGLNKNIHHWIAPLGRYRKFNVQQYYYSVADLQSRGLSANALIDRIAFEVAEAYSSGNSLRDFKISAKWVNSMPTSWITLNSNDVVYDNYWQNVNSTGGEFSFDINNLTWNGTSALVIQMSYEVDNFLISSDQNPLFKLSESAVNVSRIIQSNSSITLIGSTGVQNKSSKFRPLTKFKMSLPSKLDTIVGCSSTIDLQINNSGYQALSWDNSSTGTSRSVSTPGQYSVVLMDGNFCFSYDTVQVIFNPNSNQITASADTVVQGSAITLSAQPSYLNIWSNGASGNSVNVASSGEYFLTSINEDGCAVVDSVTVVVLDLPKIYKGSKPLFAGQVLPNYTYMGLIGTSHIYYSNSSYPFNQVRSIATQLGGKFWYPKNASENSLINSFYKSKISCCGARWIGVQRASLSDPWKDVYGNTVTYTNWDVNADPNRLFGLIEFGWNGFWTGSSNGTTDWREYFIEFQDNSSLASASETACDSLLLWTEEGFDSYIWSVDNVVVPGKVGNEIWASSNGTYTVKGVRSSSQYAGTSSVQVSVNQTPNASIINESGSTDLTGSNSIKLKVIKPAGSNVEWFRDGVSLGTADSIMTNNVGWHVLEVTLNGCSARDSVEISAPYFVATTGNNQTGDGSLGNPFATIQHAIDIAPSGSKIYVLPGTYNENVLVNKAVKLLSNYDRLGDTSAMFTTIINGGAAGRVIHLHNYTGQSKTVVSGFTIKNGFNSNNPGSGVFMQDVFGEGAIFKNLLITENVRQCCDEGIAFAQWGGQTDLINVRFVNNGSPTFWDERRDVVFRFNSISNWDRVKYVGNASQYDAISIMDGSELNIVNSLFTSSEPQDGGHGLFGIHGTSSKLTLNHVTAWNNILNTHNNQYFIRNHSTTNSVVKILNSVIDAGANQIIEIQQNNTYHILNSVLNGRIVSGTGTLDSSRVKRSGGYLSSNGALLPVSEAIGHARPGLVGGVNYSTPNTDLFGSTRPNPVGSFPDAGAIESILDVGVFGVSISQCGWRISPVILNSSSYSVFWTGPIGFTSTDTIIEVETEGTYTLTVISTDQLDTIVESVSLQNPLRAEITTKDVCLAAGSNSGYFDIRNVTGGTPITTSPGNSYLWGLRKGSIYIQGPNNGVGNYQGWWWNTNLSSGSYILELSDGAGCNLEVPFDILDKPQLTMFVSASGSDGNQGTLASPYATIQHAINQACDRDTIYILDGTIVEDSILVDKDVIITSLYSRDGDTMHIRNAVVNADFMEAAFYVNVQNSNWNQPADTAYRKFIGFTIENGQKYAGLGGGVNVTRGNVVFRHMIFRDNEGSNGGAIQVNQDAGTIVVDQSLFEENLAIHGSAFYARGGYFIVKRSTFVRNIASQQSTVYFDNWCCGQGGYVNDSKFLFNEANSYAVGEWKNWIDGQPRTTSKNVVAVGNISKNGPLFRVYGQGNGSEVVLNNWVVAKNEWPTWQSMFEFSWLTVQLNHATISHNRGGSIFNLYEESNLYATNSIIDHGSGVLSVANSQSPGTSKSFFRNVAWSSIVPSLGTHSHIGNIALSGIYFVDTLRNDFRLAKTASAIGAGQTSFLIGNKTILSPSVDLFNSARPLPVATNPDLGASESPFGSPQVGINISVVHPTLCDSTSGSITSQLINAIGNFVVTWTNVLGDTIGSQPNISGLSEGDYIVEYFDGGTNTSYIDTARVRMPDDMSVVFSVDTAACSDNAVELTINISGGTPLSGDNYNVSVVLDSSITNLQAYSASARGASISLNVKTGYYTVNIEDAAGCAKISTVYVPYNSISPSVDIVSKTGSFDYIGTPLKLYTNRSAGSSLAWSGGSTVDTLVVQAQQWITATVSKDGCTTIDSQFVSVPRFVAKTGNDQNPGTLTQPYLTIQHAINQSSAGQKIYVLPGTYAEKVLIDRPVVLQSNYDRLGDTAAMHTTIIEPGTVGLITSALNTSIQASGGVNIIDQGSSRVEISGFTIRNYVTNYSGDWHKSSQFNIYNSDNVLVENMKMSGATQGQGQGCCNAAVVFEVQYSDNVKFDNVRIVNNGTQSQNGHRMAYLNDSKLKFTNSRIVNNVQDRGMHLENTELEIENSLYSSNIIGDEGSFILSGGNNTLVWNYATARTTTSNGSAPRLVNLLGTNNKVAFLNSVVRQDVGHVVFNSGTANQLVSQTSVLGIQTLGGSTSGITVTQDSLSKFNVAPQLFPNNRLMPNSPAIGIGSARSTVFNKNYLIPNADLAGVARPNPTGSNADAGAYESALAQGELDLSIVSCGYQATATVLNSSNYLLTWSGPGGFSSTSLSPILPVKGIYQVMLISLDRQDTLVKTLNLNNPLEFTVTSVKDVCEGISTNSGSITWGNITGGVNNSNPNQWWKKKSSILNSNGSQFDGEWWIDNSGWMNTRSGMSAGTYIIKVIDGSGCAVYDTVVIGSQESNTYFISTSGSDSASGTASNPLKTISEALGRACDGDTIILEDGRHYENVILNNMSPSLTIASRYLLDGDTNHIRNAIVDGSDLNPVFHISDMNNSGTSDTLRLFGFTVTNGLANSGWNGGGGISARWSNVSIVKMHVVENRSGQNGGGIGIWECDLKLKDVLIKDNFATQDGGGLHLQYINNDLLNSNVRLVGNQASNGGGLYYSHGLGNTGQVYELDKFEVYNNYATNQGGGIFFGCWSGEADVQLSNSKVIGNRADQQAGGVVVQSNNADFNFVNVIVAKNEADYAGAMRVNNSKVHLIHSTVYSNKHKLGSQSSVLNLAVLVENQSTFKLYNSILGGQGTGGKNVYIQDNQSFFEIVSGQLGGGVSNTVQAPNTSQIIYSSSSPNYTNQQVFLKDPNGGDYSLAKVSQAIGRGLSSFTGATFPATDIFGNNRPNMFGSDPDFGAIESNDTSASFGVAFVINDNNACNTSIGQITAFPQNGSGAYSYSWTALSGGIISNPTGSGASHTIANLFTGLYRVTVTDVVTNATFTDTAEVRGDSPLVLNKTVVDEGCQGTNSGSISIDVVGGSGFYTYTWLLPNGGGTLNTKNISNLAPGVYSVTVTDNKGCSVSTTDTVGTAHAQPNLIITSQIIKAGGTTVNGSNDVRMCIGDQVVFNAGPGYSVYEWNKSDGLNTEYSQTVSSYVSETYSVFVEDSNGCSTTGTAKIFVVYEPNVYASNVNRTMGQQFQQVTSYVRGDTTAQSNVAGNEVSPYNAQGNSLKKSQFVVSASELQGAGLTENTTINSLAFDVVNPAGVAFQAYKIKLAHTTAQQLGSWQSPADQQEVFAIPVYAPVQGWNTHNFTNAFAWNGVDNLLVEVCYTPIGNTWNSATVRVNQVATANTLTNFSYSANSCSDPVQNWQMGSSTWRPTVRFGIDKVEVLDTIRVCDFTTLNTTDDYDTYTWYVNGVASPTAALALNLTSPASVVLAATDAASSCVMYSDTFYVALDTTPTVLATSNIVGAICAGDSVVLSTPSVGLASYLWSNGDTSMTSTVFESGSYILEARSANGCAGTDTVVVTVNTPPTVVVKLNGKTLTATDGSLATKVNTCVQSVLLPFGENFEDSLYVWTQATNDQLDWTFNSGATNTQFSGPNGDFTTSDSSGNYYYLDRAGANSDDNKEAHLISPCVQMIGSSRPYLTFGYHMYNGLYNAANPSSDNMGTLGIEVQTTDDAANYWVPLWTKTGHQGAGWKTDTVDLTQFAGQTIRLRIVGKAGIGGPRSEMAIDGISIIDTANSFANTSGRISADIICEGDLLIAQTISNGSTQFNYVWNTGDTTSALKVDSTGYYYVSVMDENGCSIVTDSVWIEVSPIPDNALVVTGDLSNCYNETVAVTVQAPMNYSKYSWFSNDSTIVPSGTTTTLVSLQGLAIGNYALGVRIFDSIGCAAISDTVVVNRYVQPMIQDSIVPVSCFGDSTGSILVTPLTGPMSWSWSNGDSTSANFGLPTGLYTLVFTDEHGCSDTTSMNVIEPAPLGLTFSSPSTQPVSCFGGADGSIVPIVTGGNGGYQYSWSGTQFGSTSDTLSGLSAGTYVLNVMDAKGCFISDTHVVVEPAVLSATVDSTWNASCYQANDGWISVNVAGGNGGYLMNWINSLGQSVGSNDTVTNLVAGTYQFIVTDLKGCTDSVVQVVTEPQVLDLSTVSSVFVGGNNIRCFGDSSGAITTTTVGGTLPYQWQWSNGSVADNINSLIAGTYSVVVTDLRGCQDSATVVLSEPTELLGSAVVQDVLCHDDQSGSVVVTNSGAVAPYWLDWATTGVDSGMTRITIVLDLRSAASINSPSVGIVGTANNVPMVTYHNDSIYYLTIERQPGTTVYYRFYNGAAVESVPPSCGVNPPGLTDLHRTLVVGPNDTTLNRVCFASCVDCDGQVTGARSEVLVGGSTTISSQGSGVITLTIVDANGCSVTINDTIVQPDAINIQLDTIVDVSCPQAGDGSIQLTTIGGIMPYAFDWSNGDTIEDLLTVNEGTYTITVTDFNGCVDTASYEIMAPMPYNFEEICMMTVDSLTGKNQVVWNKTPGQRTMEYQIFKETNIAGQYAQIGTVPYLNMSVFTDVNSVPQQQPDRYKIIAVDSCGNLSDTSDLHRTIHLQSNFGSGGEVNLSWTDYEGRTVQTYDIYRWVSAGNLVQIGSVSGATTTFSDLNPPVAPNVYYNVRAVFAGGACAPAAGKTSSYESARSNILDQTGIGMPDLPWKGLARMFPNPTTSAVRIEVPESGFVVRVTNMLGQLIHETSVQESSVVLDLGHVAAGMYQVELYRDGQVMSIDKLHVVH